MTTLEIILMTEDKKETTFKPSYRYEYDSRFKEQREYIIDTTIGYMIGLYSIHIIQDILNDDSLTHYCFTRDERERLIRKTVQFAIEQGKYILSRVQPVQHEFKPYKKKKSSFSFYKS